MTVLVIDEYEGFRLAMEYCLPKFGLRAVSAATLEEGVEVAKHGRVNVILLDCVNSFSAGLLDCSGMRRHEALAGIPVVLLADRVTPELAARARAVGADAVMPKIFEWPQLLGLLCRLGLWPEAPPAE